jgi:hypothetical protein
MARVYALILTPRAHTAPMSDPVADSAGATDSEATGELTPTGASSDSTPTTEATGQEQGDQSSQKRINGLMSLAQRRTAERDAALAEIEALKAQMALGAVPEDEQHKPSQVELFYPERFAAEEAGEVDAVDPMAPPEPPVILSAFHNPSRSQSVPLGDPPVIGNNSSPAARYLQDQAEIAALKTQLNRAGSQWYEDAKQRGLMD